MIEEEFVTKVVIDLSRRGFYITSNLGEEREVLCDTIEEFYQVQTVIDAAYEFGVDVSYADPLVSQDAGVV